MRTRLVAAASVCGLILLGLAGCGQPAGSGDPADGSGGPSEDAGGDTLLLAYVNDPDTLNLVTANDTVSEAFQRQVYDALAEPDFADPDKLVPRLATHWEFDPDTQTYTIHLRQGVMWHPMSLPDGTPLPETEFTAEDVKFTFDCILNKNVEAGSLRSYYEDPQAEDESQRYKIEVTIVDKYTVKVRWKKPYFLSDLFTLGIGMLPRHVYSVDENGEPISFDFSSKEFADGFNKHWANTRMCGTGPLMFKEWVRDNRLVLVRNPKFWGKPFPFAKVIRRCIPNTNTIVQKLLQNDLDFATIVQKDLYFQNLNHENVKNGKVVLKAYDYPSYTYIGYNLNKPIFQDRQFRWALAHAVPVQLIIDEVFKGLGERLTGPFLPTSSAYDKSLPLIPYDLDKSRELLAAAGWKDTDESGVLDKVIDGERVEARFDLLIPADIPQFRTVAEICQENFRRIGVEITVTPAKWALMLDKLNTRTFDAAICGWAMSWKQDPFQIWHGSLADVPHTSNHVAYRNPEVDRAIEELQVTMDPKKQTELYHKIHRLIYEDQPYTFLMVVKATCGYDGRLGNVNFYPIRPCVDSREWVATTPRLLGEE